MPTSTAAQNAIRRIENIEFLKQLTFLALGSNQITEVGIDFRAAGPWRCSDSLAPLRLSQLGGLESLSSLKLLDVSENRIRVLDEGTPMPSAARRL